MNQQFSIRLNRFSRRNKTIKKLFIFLTTALILLGFSLSGCSLNRFNGEDSEYANSEYIFTESNHPSEGTPKITLLRLDKVTRQIKSREKIGAFEKAHKRLSELIPEQPPLAQAKLAEYGVLISLKYGDLEKAYTYLGIYKQVNDDEDGGLPDERFRQVINLLDKLKGKTPEYKESQGLRKLFSLMKI